MKILRVRRGYTTNSSSASQYVPPPNMPQSAPPASPSASSLPPAAPSSPATAAPVPPTPMTVAAVPAREPQPQPSPGVSNTMLVGGLAAAVAVIFAVERLGRMIFRALRKPDRDD